MGNRKVLTILEVSQKQAYIFSSNKLKENVKNSAIIAWVTSGAFFEEAAGDLYDESRNMVYSGGGHTILQFDDRQSATAFVKRITRIVLETYPGLELFAKQYKTAVEPTAEDMKTLVGLLERKKSLRRASFRNGTFGIEKTDTNTGEAFRADAASPEMPQSEEEKDAALYPQDVKRAARLEDLGVSKEDKSFIAVVHIDGNAMGKRVEELREDLKGKDWETVRRKQRAFSDAIDRDFTDAYKEMCIAVHTWMQDEEGTVRELSLKEDYFPVRRVISAGDDICFITEGRIGLECARIFLEKLSKRTNEIDRHRYAACAGVAIVHQKYPFYRAYELAEQLCGNAKKYVSTAAGAQNAGNVSAIDWHIELGELGDTVEEIRSEYLAQDGTHLEMRPYVVINNAGSVSFEEAKTYASFKKYVQRIRGDEAYARGKYKELRDALKTGRRETENYLRSRLIDDPLFRGMEEASATDLERAKAGVNTYDKDIYRKLQIGNKPEEHAVIFDPIEAMDVFVEIEEREGK